jgi:galactokinase
MSRPFDSPQGRPFDSAQDRPFGSARGRPFDSAQDRSADLWRFVEMLRAERLFEPGAQVTIARAPGRLDVMGGIADYSGSLVLERPIAEGTCAAVQPLNRPVFEVTSIGRPPLTLPLSSLAPGGQPVAYEVARQRFASPDQHWAAYVVGVILVLARERGLPLSSGGMRVVISSCVPEGKGVSSSAALETSVTQAAAGAFNLTIEPRDVALLCQKAENLVAGAPCGVMDQMTCVFGEPGALLALLCQPAELQAPVPLPDDVAVWGIDSGERHTVSGSDYGSVRAGAFMGLRILADHLRVPGGYLANLDSSEFERLASHLPEELSGEEFLARYHGTSDPVTTVVPGRRYQVRAATAHPVYERRRAETFRRLLRQSRDDASAVQLGMLMYESHASYGRCGLGSRGTDRLVDLVKSAGPAAGLYGARITGGGSGGTVAVVSRPDASPAIARVADEYARESGHRPYIFAGSSPGAAAVGAQVVTI